MTALASREQTVDLSAPRRGPGHVLLPLVIAVLATAGA
jgi:hypothetical protein